MASWTSTSGKMVFALDNFTSINITLWSHERITSISDTLYCYILGSNNVDTINNTKVALYCYILAIPNVEMINSIYDDICCLKSISHNLRQPLMLYKLLIALYCFISLFISLN